MTDEIDPTYLRRKPKNRRLRAEPASQPNYRKLYVRIGVQDDCISWLLVELRALQKRVDKLEKQ